MQGAVVERRCTYQQTCSTEIWIFAQFWSPLRPNIGKTPRVPRRGRPGLWDLDLNAECARHHSGSCGTAGVRLRSARQTNESRKLLKIKCRLACLVIVLAAEIPASTKQESKVYKSCSHARSLEAVCAQYAIPAGKKTGSVSIHRRDPGKMKASSGLKLKNLFKELNTSLHTVRTVCASRHILNVLSGSSCFL